jgi:hypothetical protein
MKVPLKKANEYTDEELREEFNYLTAAGIFKKYTYKILKLHKDTFKTRMLRLENPELYKARHKRIWRKRLENLEAPKQPEYGQFFDVDAERLREFRKDFKKSKFEITLRELRDPYY